MAWIELTAAESGKKTRYNTQHIVTFGERIDEDGLVGSFVESINQAEVWRNQKSYYRYLKETVAEIEELLELAGEPIRRLTP